MASRWLKALRPISADAVTRVAARLEPTLRRRFLKAVKGLKGLVDLEALADALRVQSTAEALWATHPEKWSSHLESAAAILPRAFAQGGQVSASILADQLGLKPDMMRFDLTNPRAVQWARKESSRLIVEVSESVRESVRRVIAAGFGEGIPPADSARVIRTIVGLTDRQAMAVINYRFGLLEAGRTPAAVARLGERYSRKLLNLRARTIARTETIASSCRGQHELWRQATDKGLLDRDKTWREWLYRELPMKDGTFCQICQPMAGQKVGLEEPFTTGDGREVMMPPETHPSCRCSVGLSFKK